MDQISVRTPEYVSLRFQTANLGSRAVAFIIDSAIILVVQLLIGLLGLVSVGGFDGLFGMSESVFMVIAIVIVIFFVINYGYFFLFEFFMSGQTPGKRMIGIRVIHENGHNVTLLSSFIRNLLRLIDSLGGYFIGIIMVFFHSKNKRLGDLVAGTIVVHERPGKKRLSKFDRFIQSRNLPLPHIEIDEVTMRSVDKEEWILLKTYSERILNVTEEERMQLTNQLANAIFGKFNIDLAGKSYKDLENTLLSLYLILKEEWDFE